MPYKSIKKNKEYQKKYREKHKSELLLWHKKYYKANRERILKYCTDYGMKNREIVSAKGKLRRNKLRITVINGYGGRCQCCGEKRVEFMTVDHVRGGGTSHRNSKEYKGLDWLLRWIIKNNFPNSFRILCWNCNCARAYNKGVCPHEKEKITINKKSL